MNPGEIYAKTDEGVRELKERQRNLPIALRSLLIISEVAMAMSARRPAIGAMITSAAGHGWIA